MLVDDAVYRHFLVRYRGESLQVEGESGTFADLDGEPVDESFIGRKWLVRPLITTTNPGGFMTHFNIDHRTERVDRIFVGLDHRFDVATIRTESGLRIDVFPRTGGELWDDPFASFEVDETEIIDLEQEMEASHDQLHRAYLP